MDAEIKGLPPLVGAQGYRGFLLSKPVVGQNITLGAVPVYRASWFLPSRPIQLHFFLSKSSMVECVLSCESEFYL